MKHYILYYLIILPISKLPFKVLHLISGVLFFVVYHVIGYRRKVVRANISNSFPEKSNKEILAIEKEFYWHLSDLIVESLKTFDISAEDALIRMKVRNPELVNAFFDKGKSVTAIAGHNGNWELYAVACAMQLKHKTGAYYTQLSSGFFEKLMKENRCRFGLNLVPTSVKNGLPIPSDIPTFSIFAIDQCPRLSQKAYWMEFLNQETGVQFGAEKFAREHNTPVVLGNITKVKRGYYEIEYYLICENPSELPLGGILEKGTRLIEEKIREQPAYWLWSHKRWKHRREDYVK